MRAKQQSKSWGKEENELLYAAIEEVSKEYRDMDKARKRIIEIFKADEKPRTLTWREVDVKLLELSRIVGGKIDRGKLVRDWAEYKHIFVGDPSPTRIKFKNKKSSRARSAARRANAEDVDSDVGTEEEPATEAAVTRDNQKSADAAPTSGLTSPEFLNDVQTVQGPDTLKSDERRRDTSVSPQHEQPRGPVSSGRPEQEQARDKHQQSVQPSIVPAQTPESPANHPESDGNERFRGMFNIISAFWNHAPAAYRTAPDPDEIAMIIDNSLRKISGGIKCFLEAHPATTLNSSKWEPAAQELTRILVGKQNWNRCRIVESLANGPRTTLHAVLRAYGAAALHQWVFMGFNDIVRKEEDNRDRKRGQLGEHPLLTALRDENLEYFIHIRPHADVQFVDTEVKDKLPGYAKMFEKDLYNIFCRFCQDNQKDSDMSPFDRSDLYETWEAMVTEAFLEVLNLRMKLQIASWAYYSEFPTTGTGFQKREMEEYDPDSIVGDASRIFLCVQPAVWAYPRASRDPPRPIVMAQVLTGQDTSKLDFD